MKIRVLSIIVILLLVLTFFPLSHASAEFVWEVSLVPYLNIKFNLMNPDLYEAVMNEYSRWVRVPASERNLPADLNIPFRIMWFIYPESTLNGKNRSMTDSEQRQILNTIRQFEDLLEYLTNNNISVITEHKIIERQITPTGIVNDPGNTADSLPYFQYEDIEPEIVKFAPASEYNFVFAATVSPSQDVAIALRDIRDGQGVATVYPHRNSDRTLNLTVHEFLHTLEFNRDFQDFLPEVKMPHIHAQAIGTRYSGQSDIIPSIGFEEYAYRGPRHEDHSDAPGKTNGIMYMYEEFLRGEVRYTDPDTGEHKYVGMFPSIWKYIVEWQAYLADFDLSQYKFKSNSTEVVIPYGVTGIWDYTFYGFEKLEVITIPETVTFLSDKIFEFTENLTIRCVEDSVAHKYAIRHGIQFEFTETTEPLPEPEPVPEPEPLPEPEPAPVIEPYPEPEPASEVDSGNVSGIGLFTIIIIMVALVVCSFIALTIINRKKL